MCCRSGKLLPVVSVLLTLPILLPAQVEISNIETDHLAIRINGQPFSTFFIGHQYSKPFLAPLRSANGLIVTRRYPMELVDGESRDHPHHRGLFIGFGDINHVNFWETEPKSKASGENPKDKGTIRLEKLEQVKSGAKAGTIRATFNWASPGGQQIFEEERELTFYTDDAIRRFDVDCRFTARTAATFADTKEGFFAIRVADSMSGKKGGIITNSEGAQTEKDVWGKRAAWADYVGNVDGQKVGILIFDHPQNPNHPPRWHARDYGLFAVNPFGEKEFDPHSTAKGGFSLPAGRSMRFRYRVIIHSGDENKKTVARWYDAYSQSTK